MADESIVISNDTDSSDGTGDIGDVSLDAFNAPAEETTTEDEPSPVEDKTTEETDEEAAEPQTPEDQTDDDTEQQAETEQEDAVATKGMTRKERAEYYSQQEQQQGRQIEQAVAQAYQPQPVDQLQQYYMGQGHTEGEALILARQDVSEQKAQIAEASAEIVRFNAGLEVDSMEAKMKYDWMNPDKPTFNKEMAMYASELFAQGMVTDPRTGQIIDAKKTPSQVAAIVDGIYQTGVKKASVKAQKAAEQQMASVAPPSSTRQAVKSGNSLKDIEDRLKDITF